jgi:nucleotide-binding universal stress UspA family protein
MKSDGQRPVVVGVDPDRPSRLVLAWAADEADRRHLPLHLVLACRSATRLGNWYMTWPELQAETHRLRAAGEQTLAEAARFVAERHPALPAATWPVDGDPADVLRERSGTARLVVLGSRRLTAARELFSAGSVAVELIAHARCPVAVVRDPEHATRQPPYVVVGADGSPASQAAVDYAFDVAALRGAGLRVISALHPSRPAWTDENRAERDARRVLAEIAAGRRETHPDVDLTHEVVRGHPVAVLSEASAHALAVVVGTRGLGGFRGMALGSVAQGVLHHARCPVLVVPAPA